MITRVSIVVNGDVHLLSVETDVRELKHRIIAAGHANGDFVDMVATGNRSISILFTGATAVTFSSEDLVVDSDQPVRAATPFDEDFDWTGEDDWRHR